MARARAHGGGRGGWQSQCKCTSEPTNNRKHCEETDNRDDACVSEIAILARSRVCLARHKYVSTGCISCSTRSRGQHRHRQQHRRPYPRESGHRQRVSAIASTYRLSPITTHRNTCDAFHTFEGGYPAAPPVTSGPIPTSSRICSKISSRICSEKGSYTSSPVAADSTNAETSAICSLASSRVSSSLASPALAAAAVVRCVNRALSSRVSSCQPAAPRRRPSGGAPEPAAPTQELAGEIGPALFEGLTQADGRGLR